MMTAADFHRILDKLGQMGREDVDWAENLKPPEDAETFAGELIFVICNSGMQHKIARGIYDRVMACLRNGKSIDDAFNHPGKVRAILHIWTNRERLFEEYKRTPDQVTFLGELPWIGGITKYHAAKNFGVQCAKPDVHLQRLAGREGITVQRLCERLAKETGFKVATVDTVLWRACATGVIDSKTGAIR